MRYVKYAILAILAILLVSISLANRNMVELRLIPEGLADLPGISVIDVGVTLPLFVIVLGGVVTGIVIGFLWEWLREHKHRRTANVKSREVRRLETEVVKLKKDAGKSDDVLAILDKAS
jgi:uncharacterized integral membrane protein